MMDVVWCLYEDGGWHVGTYGSEIKLLEDAKRYTFAENEIFNKYAPKDENGDIDPIFDPSPAMIKAIKALNKKHQFKPEMGTDRFASISDYSDESYFYEKVQVR